MALEEVGNDRVYKNERNTSGKSYRRSTFTPPNTKFSPPYVTTAALSTGRAVVQNKGTPEPEETHERTRNTTKLDTELFTKCW